MEPVATDKHRQASSMPREDPEYNKRMFQMSGSCNVFLEELHHPYEQTTFFYCVSSCLAIPLYIGRGEVAGRDN